MQTAFYKEKTTLYTNAEDWFTSKEYDMFSSVTEYYENVIDEVLSSQSEELLLNLIHLPFDERSDVLQAQAKYLGIEKLTGIIQS